ncbi:hypothetical protein FRC03_003657 [Tulasnella sp. 419]|nr:hypothetical protein FRC03_003657 [Tulasnella sp. 419]
MGNTTWNNSANAFAEAKKHPKMKAWMDDPSSTDKYDDFGPKEFWDEAFERTRKKDAKWNEGLSKASKSSKHKKSKEKEAKDVDKYKSKKQKRDEKLEIRKPSKSKGHRYSSSSSNDGNSEEMSKRKSKGKEKDISNSDDLDNTADEVDDSNLE